MRSSVVSKITAGFFGIVKFENTDFIESHTALEDVMIEKEILAYCYRQHKKMRKKLWE